MKEIRSIIEAYNGIDFASVKAALATVVRVEGSSYRRAGARMLVLDNGTYLGGISGGCLEGDALRRAQKAIIQNKPSIITYDTTAEDGQQIGAGLGCNGIIDVLFTPLHPQHEFNVVKLLSTVIETRTPRVLISITGCNEKLNALGKAFLYENDNEFLDSFAIDSIAKQVLKDILLALKAQTSVTHVYDASGQPVKVFIEVILPVTQLVIFGSNYDIHTMVRIARELGWNVTVVTNVIKADKSLFSLATRVISNKSHESAAIDNYTALLLMEHDYKTDFKHFKNALETEVPYIGLLGPRKRSEKMFDALKEEGKPISEADLQRIYSPAGLDIGAATPEEIALSIVAEIRCHFAGRGGMPLRLRQGTIYGN